MTEKKVKNPQTCPGLKDFLRPTPSYVKCHICKSDVEIWTDEDSAICDNCGAEWKKPDQNASCLSYCEYANKCKEIINARNT
ncbi:MAG: hypothetical protein AC479_03855 [miscellaneous Crenarchaeota group-6 archaeon AD8-1]|nr:MAG: hypothetical protein AC479_03855 [miscellaneous Crenarchaeota group-6 archaeon AD8-1]